MKEVKCQICGSKTQIIKYKDGFIESYCENCGYTNGGYYYPPKKY